MKKVIYEDDDRVWRTLYGEKKTFKDITQQHWSNIIHYHLLQTNKAGGDIDFVYDCIDNIKLAINQFINRFDGKILPFKRYDPTKPETE